MKRTRLTMSQALVKFLDNQYIECDGVESEESGQLDIKDEIVLTVKNFDELKGKTLKLVWKDGSSKEIPIDSEKLKISDIFIGSVCMLIK